MTLRELPPPPTHLSVQPEERETGFRLHWLGVLFLGLVVYVLLNDWLK